MGKKRGWIAMKLKTIEVEGKQYAQIDSTGKVLYDNNGEEFAFDAGSTYIKIQELQRENKTHRESKADLESKLKSLDGIDPDKYRQAVDSLSKIDQKKLIEAGDVDKLRREIEDSFKAKYEPEINSARDEMNKMKSQYNSEKLSNAFNGSAYIRDNVAVPSDIARAAFGDRFKIEDGKMIATDSQGNTIYSRKNPGNPADFDEAIMQIIDAYPNRDSILKAANHQGTGGANSGGGQKRNITRTQFESLSPVEKASVAKSMSEGAISISE
jgi:hypothetical protein